MFNSQQVESGSIDDSIIQGVKILEARELSMNQMVEMALKDIYTSLVEGKGRERWEKP
jgi:hypothetical protein